MKAKITKDGFIWLVLDKESAIAIWKTGTAELFRLYDDESESAIESDGQLEDAIETGTPIGIEVGFVKDILPHCPRCGRTLVTSDIPQYTWQCYECDMDFYTCEL